MNKSFITYLMLLLTFMSCYKEEFNPDSYIGSYDCEVWAHVYYIDTVYRDTVEVTKNSEGQLVINFSVLYPDTVRTNWLQRELIWGTESSSSVKFNSDSIDIFSNGCNCPAYYSSFKGKKITH